MKKVNGLWISRLFPSPHLTNTMPGCMLNLHSSWMIFTFAFVFTIFVFFLFPTLSFISTYPLDYLACSQHIFFLFSFCNVKIVYVVCVPRNAMQYWIKTTNQLCHAGKCRLRLLNIPFLWISNYHFIKWICLRSISSNSSK